MKDLSLHILDIIENSVNAGANNINMTINQNTERDVLTITIKDEGIGMKKELLNMATDPFTSTKKNKKTGLGLPLFKQAVENANGELSILSRSGKGTEIKASFQNSHIDRKPLGDLAETFISSILLAPGTNFIFRYKHNKSDLVVNTKELKEQIGVTELTDTNVLKELKEIIKNKLKPLQEQ